MRRRHWLPGRTLHFKLLSGFVLLVVPLVAFMIYNNMYAIDVVRNQVAQSNKNMISLYMNQIDGKLEEVEKHLYNVAAEDTGLLVLEQPRSRDEDQYQFEKIQLYRSMLKDLANYRSIDFFVMYSPVNDDLMLASASHIQYSEQIMAEASLRDLFQKPDAVPDKRWFVYDFAGKNYLTHVVHYSGMYIGALSNTAQHIAPLSLLDLGQEGRAFLVTGDYAPLANDADQLAAQGVVLDYTGADYKLTGDGNKYILVGDRSHRGDFGLTAIIPNSAVLENLPFLRRIVAGITVGALIILPAILLLLRKLILLPVNRIVRAMRRIEDGNLDVRIDPRSSALEFEVMNHSFNRMLDQIQQLTVHVLTEQVQRQRAELKQLQLQINPHFFLNSLNIIYNLAQVKDYRLIQEMSHSLVQYFRFMFRSDSSFVPLGEELEHTYNYLRIQELRFPDDLTFRLMLPDELREVPVPPLMVQTFAENAIKHGMNVDQPLHIEILVSREQWHEEMLHICISDTGCGFQPEVLDKLQHNAQLDGADGEQIGIWNVRQRLQLLYEGRAQLLFSARAGGGAVVEIWLPAVGPEGEQRPIEQHARREPAILKGGHSDERAAAGR